jgi:Flp pilus assembly pilin Flp
VALMVQRHVSRALLWHEIGCGLSMQEHLWRDQGSASLIDYAILVAVIYAIVIAAVALAGAWIHATWVRVHLMPLLGQLLP